MGESNTEENLYEIALENSKEYTEYQEHLNKAIKLGQRIMDFLGPEGKKLFLEYEASTCLAKRIKIEVAYNLGLEHGSMPNKMPNSLS
ncbi:hypothetical protein DEAC_c14610 [Desulfosporosinus acididurans]|uniref:Uncharacterized protein n=1 Tax=Desulfosporosinus acididurans TaxID=476652 RepID=A0A0J1FUW9_9FIRM|nr:hypothetical protein [Desulfosporosinus acididurans]KLU66793.1 hypothetical protein DEAC_c14610 [Desulfosporosinus acididurans]